MTESSGITWSTSQEIKEQAKYELLLEQAGALRAVIDRCQERGLNNHFISGLELAHEIVLGNTNLLNQTPELDSDTLF